MPEHPRRAPDLHKPSGTHQSRSADQAVSPDPILTSSAGERTLALFRSVTEGDRYSANKIISIWYGTMRLGTPRQLPEVLQNATLAVIEEKMPEAAEQIREDLRLMNKNKPSLADPQRT